MYGCVGAGVGATLAEVMPAPHFLPVVTYKPITAVDKLMIVVTIVAILAAIAMPAYQEYAKRARRADAKAGILALELAQEKLRANCAFYAQSIGANNVCGANAGATTVAASATSPDDYYNLAIVAASASSTAYLVTATPEATGLQFGDDCGTFALDQNGANHTGSYASATCWDK